jgi:anti-anti-sigma regulatory factor
VSAGQKVADMSAVSSQITLIRGVPVVAGPSRLDRRTSSAFRIALARPAERGHATVVVDLTATQSCDADGAAILLRAHERACAEGGELRLAGARLAVLRGLYQAKAGRVPRRYANVEDAVAELPAVAIAPPVRQRRTRPPAPASA